MRKAMIIPILIGGLTLLAFATTNVYRVPTLELTFPGAQPAVAKTVEFAVDGVRCKGTSNYFAQKLSRVPGVVSLTTYARTNLAIVEYDPAFTSPEAIRAAYEAPDTLEGEVYQVFRTRTVRDLR